jgi:hypothetical protein
MAQHLNLGQFSNYTNSSLDILLAVPRFARRAGAFAIHFLPEQLDGFLTKILAPGNVIAEATIGGVTNLSSPAVTNTTKSLVAISTAARSRVAGAAAAAGTSASIDSQMSFYTLFTVPNFRTITNFGSYVLSKWALATFMVVCNSITSDYANCLGYCSESNPSLRLGSNTSSYGLDYQNGGLSSSNCCIVGPDPAFATSFAVPNFARLAATPI